ncbi:hypothetical protein C5S39_13860 [Candidatus Methanophagaceae archaeon]|nr:hypothetical protein C5S39_13860 [Methanophagales archaeon]
MNKTKNKKILGIGVVAALGVLAILVSAAAFGIGSDDARNAKDIGDALILVSASDVTASINYQGKLTDNASEPLSGTYTMAFRSYDVATGGTALDTDTHTVKVTDGLFNTHIDFNQSYFDGRELWLGITVGTDFEMMPRYELSAVPYALSLKPGAVINGSVSGAVLYVTNTYGDGLLHGDWSKGISASTSGNYSNAFHAYTSGDSSNGFYAYTSGNFSDGVTAFTRGYGSGGVTAFTRGYGSGGVTAWTFGDSSDGITAETYGNKSDGVTAHTSGNKSRGVYAQTNGDSSDGFSARTYGEDSAGVSAKTYGNFSDGVSAFTDGDNSDGVGTRTYGDNSDGVSASTGGNHSGGVIAYTHGNYSTGVYAFTHGNYSTGVYAWTYGENSRGVDAYSAESDGIYANTGRSDHRYGVCTDDYMYALRYEGGGGDVAEYFAVDEDVEPGTVMVIGEDSKLQSSITAYDTTVAGIVSTAPGVSLGANETGNAGEKLIAVAGRVPCKVDASYASVKPGDLLTTSDTRGHAMKATNPQIGTILGKALEPLDSGTGVIEVLVTLQ